MYRPQGAIQKGLSVFTKAVWPYLSHFTYQYHVERARVAGLRVEDTYDNKFFREPFIAWHVYAQNFHPTTLLERVRDVTFYRKTNTLFKGFAVPDWAHSHKRDGWDVDLYSRMAWDNAMKDMKSEWTPTPFSGDRLEPNMLNWARHEHSGKGHSSRLFYNEDPQPSFWRHGGNFGVEEKARLQSFKYADQESDDLLGFDTSTPEGRAELKREIVWWKEIAPEMFANVDLDADVGVAEFLSSEPHFRRVWNHYRQFQFNARVEYLIEQGDLSAEDLQKAQAFFDASGLPSANMYSLAQRGLLGDVSKDPSFEAFQKILKWLGLDNIKLT